MIDNAQDGAKMGLRRADTWKCACHPQVVLTTLELASGALSFTVNGPVQADCEAVAEEFLEKVKHLGIRGVRT